MTTATLGNRTAESISSFIEQHLKPLIVIGVLIIALFIGYSTWSSLWSQGIRYETQLSAQYLDNQNYLSAYISGFYEEVGIARTASESINTVLADAVKGRYENTSGGGGYTVNSPFFNAIAEAYPDITVLQANWGKIQDYIASGRESYRNAQSKLLDQLRNYDTWRNSGIASRFIIGLIGIPSENLKARIGTQSITGTAALDKMYQIVLTSDTIDAYNDGILDPLKP